MLDIKIETAAVEDRAFGVVACIRELFPSLSTLRDHGGAEESTRRCKTQTQQLETRLIVILVLYYEFIINLYMC